MDKEDLKRIKKVNSSKHTHLKWSLTQIYYFINTICGGTMLMDYLSNDQKKNYEKNETNLHEKKSTKKKWLFLFRGISLNVEFCVCGVWLKKAPPHYSRSNRLNTKN